MDIEKLCQRYFKAWDSRDVDAIMALHTPDTIFHSHTNQEPQIGREKVRAAFTALIAMVPDISFKAWDIRFGEDFWVAQMIVSGQIPQGGNAFEYSSNSLDVIVARNGLVYRKDSYLDLAKWSASSKAHVAA